METHQLPAYCRTLLDKAEDVSGFPIQIEEKDIGTEHDLLYPTAERRMHLILIPTQSREGKLHYVVNSATRILRLWNSPPEERWLHFNQYAETGIDPARYPKLFEGTRVRKKLLPVLSTLLYFTLARLPEEIRTEKELKTALPEHFEIQRKFLGDTAASYAQSFSDSKRSLPVPFRKALTAMFNCLITKCYGIAETALPEQVYHHPSFGRGKYLSDLLNEVKEPGPAGDRLATEAWEKEFGLEGFVGWRLYKAPAR